MNTLTLFHVIISFVALSAGFVIAWGMLTRRPLNLWHAIFLITTVATNATGFLFPFKELLPSHILAVISLVVLAVAIYAYYGAKLAGRWRSVYAITAILAFYVNFFVLLVQAFLKVPVLNALAPTQQEPPFLIAQTLALVAFGVLGWLVTKRFKAS